MTDQNFENLPDTLDNLPTVTYSNYGIVVRFNNYGKWSKEYTYSSTEPIAPDSLVVIANNDNFVSVARVKRCISGYKFLPGVNYKSIIEVLKTTAKDL